MQEQGQNSPQFDKGSFSEWLQKGVRNHSHLKRWVDMAYLPQKWIHLFGPLDGNIKVDSFFHAAFFNVARGGTPSGNCC